MIRSSVRSAVAMLVLVMLTFAFGMVRGASPLQAADASVTIVDFSFNPNATTVSVGSTVHWKHNGVRPHTTTSDTGLWDSHTLMNGGTFDFTFTTPGTFPYHCSIHPSQMMGTITVTGAASSAVSIVDFAFNPTPLTVPVGSTVHWTHNGMRPHTTTSDSGVWDSGTLMNGGTFDFTFNTPGTFTYHCSIHPTQMMASIVVTAGGSAPPSTTAPSGGGNASTGNMVAYKSGVNLIGVPAGTAINPIAVFAFDPASNTYSSIQPGEIRNGKGYWVYFADAPNVTLAAGVNTPVSVDAPANQYTIIGNPSGTRPATVTGADAVFTYNATTGAYVATKTLQPGDGAWAFSAKGGQVTITPNP